MFISFIIVVLLSVFSLFFFVFLYFLSPRNGRPSFSIPPQDAQTFIDKRIKQLAQEHQGLGLDKDALGLIISNFDAFAGRILATSMAGRSLDLMYYIWNDDLTGRLLLYEVLKAADRGVRVRLLLDDINAYGRDPIYAALDRHPYIEVRIFNPSIFRAGRLKRLMEMFFRAFSITRRMHNKAYIVDGRIAFIGGRNIADEYFDAGQKSNFRDLDLMLIGPTVKKVGTVFDLYWNSESVKPINVFAKAKLLRNLDYWREMLKDYRHSPLVKPYSDYIEAYVDFDHFLRVGRLLFPAKKVSVLADPPEKALNRNIDKWMVKKLFKFLSQATKTIEITSPYFVPGKEGTRYLGRLAKRGVAIKILTNSFAATDVPAVHGGYIHYRKKLLRYKIGLYELKQQGSIKQKLKLLRLKHASLHTKAFLIDKKMGFVGSFNFDPRSVTLNTEMGLFFECEPIALRMDILFSEEITPEMSYKLELSKGRKICWHWTEEGVSRKSYKEPEVFLLQRIYLKIISWLPIESQL